MTVDRCCCVVKIVHLLSSNSIMLGVKCEKIVTTELVFLGNIALISSYCQIVSSSLIALKTQEILSPIYSDNHVSQLANWVCKMTCISTFFRNQIRVAL